MASSMRSRSFARWTARFAALFGLAISPTTIATAQVKFVDVAPSKGMSSFTPSPGDGHAPGSVFTDLNGDGYADIYMMRAFNQSNGLFLNTPSGGGRTFVRATNDAGLGDRGSSNGAITADYDNDGDLDMFVINWNEPNQLYRNELTQTGQLQFTNVTAQTDPTPGVADGQQGVSGATHGGVVLDNSLTAAWGDPDRDGDLDLYVGNHHEWFGSPFLQPGEVAGQRDIFYRNNGDGTFTDATIPLGLTGYETASGADSAWSQNFSSSNAVMFADFNNDQWPDLLVTNKVGGPNDRDMLYVNQGADEAGQWLGYEPVTYTLPTTFGNRSGGAMGVDVADVDHDGDLDFYITDWSNPAVYPDGGSNDLWINQLSETGTLDFVHSTELPALYSWGTQIADFDNDGYEDVHVVTQGSATDFLYLGSANGFSGDVAAAAGVAQTEESRGDNAADYNRDGLLDLLVINPWDGPVVLYENRSDEVSPNNHFLSVQLTGDPTLPGKFRSSRDAIGARVYVSADLDGDGSIEAGERMIREVASGTSNAASTSSLELEFGLGLATTAEVEILWPSGRRTNLTVTADQFLSIEELLADINGDGSVDADDALAWENGFGTVNGALHSDGDVDLDGDVDGVDFLHLQRSLSSAEGIIAPSQTVPEPSTSVLVAALVVASAFVRDRHWRFRLPAVCFAE